MTEDHHILTLSCTDRPGLVHAVCAGLLDVEGNIMENQQFTEPNTGTFCMRLEVAAPTVDSDTVAQAVAARLPGPDIGDLRVRPRARRPRMMIMVSRYDHCLVDLLYRWRTGALSVDIPLVVSNHNDLRSLVEAEGIAFHHLPVDRSAEGPTSKPAQEAAILDLIDANDVDVVVLARYMQILSDDLCRRLNGRAINIHHSFLPGFKGAKPYHQAHERGVKLVGATAHFVTADLDEGPIIEQDVARVDHTKTAEQLVALGQDTERLVLARAVRLWAEDRIFLVGTKTVVFS